MRPLDYFVADIFYLLFHVEQDSVQGFELLGDVANKNEADNPCGCEQSPEHSPIELQHSAANYIPGPRTKTVLRFRYTEGQAGPGRLHRTTQSGLGLFKLPCHPLAVA